MAKRVYKYFGAMIELQENWLNNMAAKGYKLTKCAKTYYEFEECEPNAYNYQIDLVIDKKANELEEMKNRLINNGFNVFSKNISLNTVVGMIFFKSPMSFTNKFLNSPDILNKELLIIECVNNGDKITLTNSNKTKEGYYKSQQNAYIAYMIFWIIMAIVQFTRNDIGKGALFIVLAILNILPTYIYRNHIKHVSSKEKIKSDIE